MNDDSLIMRSGELIDSITDDGAVVLNVETGVLYGLNATAAMIWKAIEQPTVFREIARDLCARFEAEETTIRRDVTAMLAILVQQGIIAIGQQGADATITASSRRSS
jgi:hypothetical protein